MSFVGVLFWGAAALALLFFTLWLSDRRFEYRTLDDTPAAWIEFERLKRDQPTKEWMVYYEDHKARVLVLRGRRWR